jgi:hypothetical protein
MSTLQNTKETMQAMLQDTHELPRIASKEERVNRVKMLLSEVAELAEAYGVAGTMAHLLRNKASGLDQKHGDFAGIARDTDVVNLLEVFDAECDIQEVLNGAVIQDGMTAPFSAGMGEVARSNRSKACDTEEEAIAAVGWYATQATPLNIHFRFNPQTGKYVLFDSFGKYKKRPNYREARLWTVLAPYLSMDMQKEQIVLNHLRVLAELEHVK